MADSCNSEGLEIILPWSTMECTLAFNLFLFTKWWYNFVFLSPYKFQLQVAFYFQYVAPISITIWNSLNLSSSKDLFWEEGKRRTSFSATATCSSMFLSLLNMFLKQWWFYHFNCSLILNNFSQSFFIPECLADKDQWFFMLGKQSGWSNHIFWNLYCENLEA